jgi:HSP20 family molecular chaperone IbpA
MAELPAEVDESKAKARYENGVLTLTLPRKEGAGRSGSPSNSDGH